MRKNEGEGPDLRDEVLGARLRAAFEARGEGPGPDFQALYARSEAGSSPARARRFPAVPSRAATRLFLAAGAAAALAAFLLVPRPSTARPGALFEAEVAYLAAGSLGYADRGIGELGAIDLAAATRPGGENELSTFVSALWNPEDI